MDHETQKNGKKCAKRLDVLFAEYVKLSFPGISVDFENLYELISDAQADLASDDVYLAGLAHSFWGAKRIDVKEILIDSSIDSRIESALKIAEQCREDFLEFKEYRQKMLELANTLSVESGVPIRKWRREE